MINSYYLKYFIDTIEQNSLTKAAAINHVSIPAISKGIRNLEDFLGFKLLDHGKNKLIVLNQGYAFYEKAKPVLISLDNLLHDTKIDNKLVKGNVNFAANTAFATIIFPLAFLNIKKKYPQLNLNFKSGFTSTVSYFTSQDKTDFGINLHNQENEKFERKVLYRGSFVLIQSSKVKQAKLKYLMTKNGIGAIQFKKNYLKKIGEHPSIELEVSSWEVILEMVLNGTGIGLIPDFYLWKINKRKFVHVKSPVPLAGYEMCLYTKRGKFLNFNSMRVIEEIKKVISKFQ